MCAVLWPCIAVMEPAQCPWVRVQRQKPLLSLILSNDNPCEAHRLGGFQIPPATLAEFSYLLLIHRRTFDTQELSRLHGLSMSMATRATSRLEIVLWCKTMRVVITSAWLFSA